MYMTVMGAHLTWSLQYYVYKESQTNVNLTKVSLVYLGGFYPHILKVTIETMIFFVQVLACNIKLTNFNRNGTLIAGFRICILLYQLPS